MYNFKYLVFVVVLCKLLLLCMPIVVDGDNVIPTEKKLKSALLIFPRSDSNHQLFGHKIGELLSDIGYQITFISHLVYHSNSFYPGERYVSHQLPPSFEELEEAYETRTNYITYKKSFFTLLKSNVAFGEKMSEYVLNFPILRAIMERKDKFDVIILDVAYCEALIGLGQHFKAPVILISVEGYNRFLNGITGNPSPVSYVSNEYGDFTNTLSFSDRFVNSFQNVYQWYYLNMYHYGKQKSIYNTNFPNTNVPFEEALKYVDFVLFNSNYLLTGVRPTLPNMINIGGIHLMEERQPLDRNLLKFLDDAPVGVVLFSLGDTFRHTTIPEEKLQEMFALFGSLPVSFVCRSNLIMERTPPNVFVSRIIPQAEILAHPKVVLFITSGELISMFEAMFHNVPIIGIPLMPSHAQYINKAVNDGWGMRIDYNDLNAIDLLVAITTITFKSTYYKVVIEHTKLYIEEYKNAENLFKYWIQYLEKHCVDNKYHITSPGHEMYYIVYHSIDTLIAIVIIILIAIAVLVLLWFCCCNYVLVYIYREKKKRQRIGPLEISMEMSTRPTESTLASTPSVSGSIEGRSSTIFQRLAHRRLVDPSRRSFPRSGRAISESRIHSGGGGGGGISETRLGRQIYFIVEDPIMGRVQQPIQQQDSPPSDRSTRSNIFEEVDIQP